MGSILFNIIVQPLIYIVDFIFSVMYRTFGNPGIAIIAVSLVVNFLVLPLYRKADLVQEAERDKQKQMACWIRHIRKTFKGDERFMMLQTYYRQQDYHPLYVLRGSVSLFLQIPFFMAAYNYLSNLEILRNASFGPLQNLGAPDQLLVIGGIGINVLPIMMTVFNFISGAIYTKGFPLKSKLQLYGIALIFLVILYKSPSGLVMYWTMNNLFSLLKNVFFKQLKHPREVFAVIAVLFGTFVSAYVLHMDISKPRILFAGILLAACIYPGIHLLWEKKQREVRTADSNEKRAFPWFFAAGGLFNAVLMGIMIPMSVVSVNPSEFVEIRAFRNPLQLIGTNFLVCFGLFLVWMLIFYYLASDDGKKTMAGIQWGIALVSVTDYMLFGKNLGNIRTNMVLDAEPVYSRSSKIINIFLILVLLCLLAFLMKRFRNIAYRLGSILLISAIGFSTWNLIKTQKQISGIKYEKKYEANAQDDMTPVFHLSRNGKNVIVIMLDRAISGYIPFIMNEKPGLAEVYSGFTYYPNTVSCGPATNFGTPGLFGGYDYTLEEMNRKADQSLKEKQNEALMMMPDIFYHDDYHVTVLDPPYANYQFIPDVSIFKDYPGMEAKVTKAHYSAVLNNMYAAYNHKTQKRNIFFYSLFKSAPVAFQKWIYDGGDYLGFDDNDIPTADFINSYSVLMQMKELTDFSEDGKNAFLMFQNATPHEAQLLQMPEYTPAIIVNNEGQEQDGRVDADGNHLPMENWQQRATYHCNMASLLRVGEWLNFLKQEGVYDNSRIIIAADHGSPPGAPIDQFEYMKVGGPLDLDVEHVNPLLLIKDFGSTGFSTSDEFMTLADIPTFATKDVIRDPVNPFTGNPVNSDRKTDPIQVTFSGNWNTEQNNGNTFDTSDSHIYTVQDNIFDAANWKLAE